MNSRVRKFYHKNVDEEMPVKLYHDVIALHDTPTLQWEEIKQKAPSLPKGWYELALLPPDDKIAFVKEFWLSTLAFVPHVHTFLHTFFSRLDDIGIYLIQPQFDSPYECELVYSLSDDSSFFHGSPFVHNAILRLKEAFNDLLPKDYLDFLKIHDGFSKHSDTGIITSNHFISVYEKFQGKIQNEIIYCGRNVVEPTDLIPFYESFGQPSFQCFYLNWTPMGGAGNVFYSLAEGKISDVYDQSSWSENLAFPTFLDWLIFYLA